MPISKKCETITAKGIKGKTDERKIMSMHARRAKAVVIPHL